MRRLFVALLLSLAIACGREATTPTSPIFSGTLSAVARSYLNELIGFMQSHSIHRLTIDWAALRTEVIAAAGPAQTIAETLPAIRVALARLGDGHSSFRTVNGSVIFVPNRSCSGSGGPGRGTLPDSIGYISVPAFSGTTADALAFANGIQAGIRAADRDGLAGWIVDLRGNGGGNMWPMVAGLGPVIGEGVIGFFISPDGVELPWEYRDGASWYMGAVAQRVDAPYRLRRERPRVAVLQDNAVASSGEATLIAFRQRPDTRFFGIPTCGLSTSNRPFTMSDGAVLNLTTAVMADRSKARYGDSIAPDEVITGRDELWARALGWLLGT